MKKILATVLSFALVLSMLSGCDNSNNGGAANKPADKPARTDLNLSTTSGVGSLDPHFYTAANDGRFVNNIYDALYDEVYKDDANGLPVKSLEPILATGCEVNADATEYTFKLKQGVKFHNGDIMKASDVVYSIKRCQTAPAFAMFTGPIADVVEVDESTVKVTLSSPFAGFLSSVQMIKIVNQKFFEENGDKVNELECGTGAYTLTDIVPEQKYTFTAFEDYHMGVAPIKTVIYKVIPDQTTALTSFEAGEIDYVNITSEDWNDLAASGKYNTYKYASATLLFFIYNNEKAPFNDIRVRQAINYAIDREGVNTLAVGGSYVEAYEVGCPGLVYGAVEVDNRYTYDVEKAKSLLAEAGYPDGIDTGMVIKTFAGAPFEKLAIALQQSLADINIKVGVEIVEANTYLSTVATGDFDFGVMGITLPTDYHYFSFILGSANINSSNFERLNDPKVDDLFARGASEPDEAKRLEIYKELANYVNDQAPIAPVLYMTRMLAFNKDLNVKDSAMSELAYDFYWTK